MTQEEKQLVLQDICGRLPYGVIVDYKENEFETPHWKITTIHPDTFDGWIGYDKRVGAGSESGSRPFKIGEVKPYLRSMASMTEEEWEELNCIGYIVPLYDGCFGVDMRAYCKNSQPHYRRFSEFSTIEDWFNAHHFDYRGLIEKGLALEAPDGMYNIKEYNKI